MQRGNCWNEHLDGSRRDGALFRHCILITRPRPQLGQHGNNQWQHGAWEAQQSQLVQSEGSSPTLGIKWGHPSGRHSKAHPGELLWRLEGIQGTSKGTSKCSRKITQPGFYLTWQSMMMVMTATRLKFFFFFFYLLPWGRFGASLISQMRRLCPDEMQSWPRSAKIWTQVSWAPSTRSTKNILLTVRVTMSRPQGSLLCTHVRTVLTCTKAGKGSIK